MFNKPMRCSACCLSMASNGRLRRQGDTQSRPLRIGLTCVSVASLFVIAPHEAPVRVGPQQKLAAGPLQLSTASEDKSVEKRCVCVHTVEYHGLALPCIKKQHEPTCQVATALASPLDQHHIAYAPSGGSAGSHVANSKNRPDPQSPKRVSGNHSPLQCLCLRRLDRRSASA